MKYRINENYKRSVLPTYSENVPTYVKIKVPYIYENDVLVECKDLSSVSYNDIVMIDCLVVSGEKNIQKIADSYKSQSLDSILDKFGLDYVLNQTKGFNFSNDIVEYTDCDKLDTAMNYSKICDDIRAKTGKVLSNQEILSNLKTIYKDYVNSLVLEKDVHKKVEENNNETL